LLMLTKYYPSDQIKINETGRACGRYGGKEQIHRDFWWESLSARDHLKNPDVDGRKISKQVLKKLVDRMWNMWFRKGTAVAFL